MQTQIPREQHNKDLGTQGTCQKRVIEMVSSHVFFMVPCVCFGEELVLTSSYTDKSLLHVSTIMEAGYPVISKNSYGVRKELIIKLII